MIAFLSTLHYPFSPTTPHLPALGWFGLTLYQLMNKSHSHPEQQHPEAERNWPRKSDMQALWEKNWTTTELNPNCVRHSTIHAPEYCDEPLLTLPLRPARILGFAEQSLYPLVELLTWEREPQTSIPHRVGRSSRGCGSPEDKIKSTENQGWLLG